MFKNYVKAARLRTLPLSLSGIIVGSFLAASQHLFYWNVFILALLTTVGFQVVSNFANDYGDGVKGSDKNRNGEARMVSLGVITPKQMKSAVFITSVITLCIALLLIYVAFGKENFGYSLLFLLLGILSIVAAIKYTVGKSAYGYSGFGDVFVFLFFGLLSVVGSCFLYTKTVDLKIFLPAISVGLLSTAVLNLNNLRDREQDAQNNKNTLVVKLGTARAKIYHYMLILGALVSALVFVFIDFKSITQLLFLIAFVPLTLNMRIVDQNTIPQKLDSELKKVALSTFLFSVLFGFGLII